MSFFKKYKSYKKQYGGSTFRFVPTDPTTDDLDHMYEFYIQNEEGGSEDNIQDISIKIYRFNLRTNGTLKKDSGKKYTMDCIQNFLNFEYNP
jgi:hypothetical protein